MEQEIRDRRGRRTVERVLRETKLIAALLVLSSDVKYIYMYIDQVGKSRRRRERLFRRYARRVTVTFVICQHRRLLIGRAD